MGRSSTSLSEEEWGRYRSIIEDLLLAQGLTNKACCAYLKKYYNVNVDTRQLQYRVKEKWGHQRNLKASVGVQAFQTGLLEKPPSKWTQHEQKVRERMKRAVKRTRADLPSALPPSRIYGNFVGGAVEDLGLLTRSIEPRRSLQNTQSSENFATQRKRPDIISTEDICRDLTLQLRQGTAIPPAHDRNTEDFMMDGLALDDRRDSDLKYITQMIQQKDACKGFQLVLGRAQSISLIHGRRDSQNTNNKEEWNFRFVEAFINYAIYLSNNNLLRNHRVKYLLRHLQDLPEFRSLLEWMLEKYPAATKGLVGLALKHTMHAKQKPVTLNLPTLISFGLSCITGADNINAHPPQFRMVDQENDIEREKTLIDGVLRNGRPWCLETLYEGNLLLESELEIALKTIITGPEAFTVDTISKIYWLVQKGLPMSTLDRYSDANLEYQGWDLGTKLFLIVSSIQSSPKVSDDSVCPIFCDDVAQYLVANCVSDCSKALVNTIMPISYLRKKKKFRDPATGVKEKIADWTINTRGPTLGRFCAYKGINYLLRSNVDINSVWSDNRGKPYHVLTLALKNKRRREVIKYLLESGADVNLACGNFRVKSPDGSLTIVSSTPLYEAIRSNVSENLDLVLARQPEILDPALCLYLTCRSRPIQASKVQKWKDGIVGALRKTFQTRRQELNLETISQWDELHSCIIEGREEVLEQIILARSGTVPVDVIFTSLKAKTPVIFKMSLPLYGANGNLEARKAILGQVLAKLQQDTKMDYLFCTHKTHNSPKKTAHRPIIVYSLWEEIVNCGVLPAPELREKMIAPIFWSAIWEEIPERSKYQELLKRIMTLIMGREATWEEASQYRSTHFIDALCQPFKENHRLFFERGVDAAIRLKWDLASKMSDGLNILHFAVAISAKAALNLMETGLLRVMDQKSRAKLLVLAVHYGRKDIVEALLTDQGSEFVNQTSTLEGFAPLHSAAVPRSIKGTTTALHVATFHGRKDIIKLLLSEGADINMTVPRKPKGKAICPEYKAAGTALVIAAGEGLADIVDLLLQHKPAGLRLAARIASERGHTEIAHTIGLLCSPQLV